MENCSFEIRRGELINIVGPNGCGKSTIMEGLCGIKKPDRGKIERKKGIKISYMPQIINISRSAPITVEYLLNAYAGKHNSDLLTGLKLNALMGNQLTSLSGGEIQKAIFYMIATQDSDLFFLDEPENHMDDDSVEAVIGFIKSLTQNRSVVWISHERKRILKESSHVLNIKDGVFLCRNHDHCIPKKELLLTS